jgi:hypothetical protein
MPPRFRIGRRFLRAGVLSAGLLAASSLHCSLPLHLRHQGQAPPTRQELVQVIHSNLGKHKLPRVSPDNLTEVADAVRWLSPPNASRDDCVQTTHHVLAALSAMHQASKRNQSPTDVYHQAWLQLAGEQIASALNGLVSDNIAKNASSQNVLASISAWRSQSREAVGDEIKKLGREIRANGSPPRSIDLSLGDASKHLIFKGPSFDALSHVVTACPDSLEILRQVSSSKPKTPARQATESTSLKKRGK